MEHILKYIKEGKGLNKSALLCTLLILSCSQFLMFGCASLGTPDGGPYDETPPKVVQCTPDNKAINSSKKKINILFDEYIKMENAS